MTEIKSPNKLPKTVFLAGGIDMGEAENWRKMVIFLKKRRKGHR
jgi:hypothetical protein